MAELTDRQRREREHHDAWAEALKPDELLVEDSFQATTAQENRFILEYFGGLRGKRILDLGAGAGEAALYFASCGAEVTALDISRAQLDVLQRAAADRKLAVEVTVGSAEQLPFAEGSFDFVYGNGVLHHVELRSAIPEVRRVLKRHGKAAFIEPLAYNPAIWMYRRMATDVRTPDERPLTRADVAWVVSELEQSGHREFWILGLYLFIHFWLVERVGPSEDRYWKKVIRDSPRYERIAAPLFTADRVLAHLPGVRWLAWNTVIFGERGS